METLTHRKGLRRLGLLAAVMSTATLFLALGAQSAFGGTVLCSFDSATAQLAIVVSDANAAGAGADNTIVVTRGIADSILVNGVNCVDGATLTTATTLNTRQVNVLPLAVTGAEGDDVLVIDERAGRFVPGAPGAIVSGDLNAANFAPGVADGQGLNELEWWVELNGARTSSGNQISFYDVETEGAVVVGSDGGGSFWDGTVPIAPAGATPPSAAGLQGGDVLLNINSFPGDADADVFAPITGTGNSISRVNLLMGGGDDFASGKGGNGTGAIATVPLYIDGGSGNDSCQAGIGPDTIVNCEFIDGNSQAGSIVRPRQNDLLGQWELGSFSGDIADFSGQAGPLTITMNPNGSLTVVGATVSITAVGIDGVIGSQGDDVIRGNGFQNLLVGCGGNDTISGGDETAGTPGDFIDGDNVSGRCAIAGTAGNDTLDGGQGNDTVVGGPGDDTINENTGVNSAGFQNGADAIDGGPGIDTVDYSGRTTRVVVYLGLISTFNDGADTNADGLTNEFDDVFFTTENVKTGSNQDIISANFVNNRSDNVFTDNGGNDCLEGGPGNDTFVQGTAPQGADVMVGDTGTDTADYSGRPAEMPVAVALDGVANDGDIATNEGDNVGGFSVSCRPQTILVNPPISIVSTSSTGSSFIVSTSTQFLDAPVAGPSPNCVLVPIQTVTTTPVTTTPTGLPIIGLLRQPQGFILPGSYVCNQGETLGGDQAPLTNADVENVNGGSGNDQLVGNAVGNVLNGNGGDDVIDGGAATDQLNGGAGDDRIAGGDGNDAFDGGEGTNWADFSQSASSVQVNLTTGTATGQGSDTLKNIQNVEGTGSADSLSGNEQANVLNGAGGNDAIAGNAGDDTLNGGSGADQMSGQGGADKIAGGEGQDAAQGGGGPDWMQGGQGGDTLLGQQGNDQLFGNAQPDFLNGGRGQNVCKPGSPGLARGDVIVNCP